MIVALLTWMWQGLAIAGIVAALLAVLPRLSAAWRHLVWWAACGAVVALPGAYVLTATFAAAPASGAVPVPAPPDGLATLMLTGWAAFTGCALVRVALALRKVILLKRSARPLEYDLASASASCRHSPSRSSPAVGVSDQINGACALGLGRPLILLSRSLVNALERDEIEAVVMHERAHLERRDDWWQLLDSIVFALAGWHPAVRLIGRRIALEREAACDDIASRAGHDARAYASALVRAASVRSPGGALTAVPCATAPPSLLRRRIERLLNPDLRRTRHVPSPVAIAAAAITVVMLAALARMPAFVAVVDAVTELPHVRVPWIGAAAVADPAAVSGGDSITWADRPLASKTTRAAAVVTDTPPAPREAASDTRQPLEPLPGAALTTVGSLPTVETGPIAPPLPSTGSWPGWGELGRSTAAVGVAIGRAGGSAGGRARQAGNSIGRLFTRAGKAIGGAF